MMKSERPAVVMSVSLLVVLAGLAMACYPYFTGKTNSAYGYVVLGTFIALVGGISAAIFRTRSKVQQEVLLNPLLEWQSVDSESSRNEDFPGSVRIAATGMLWAGELYPFKAFHCSLVDIWVENEPTPMLHVAYTTRDRVGRKRHTLSAPLPAELISKADQVSKRLVQEYRLVVSPQRRKRSMEK